MKDSETTFESVFPDKRSIDGFQEELVTWFEESGRNYPWRETADPYSILVSELMLQQTRIATVLDRGYYTNWINRFPDWKALAGAEEEEVLKAWEGLGYYNRARNLHKAAQVVCRQYDGKMPEEIEQILELPGVGRYTAGAVMSFAFNMKATIVDGNVARVLARVLGYKEPVDSTKAVKWMWDRAGLLTPEKSVRSYNSAIMELGQRVCMRTSPLCGECPVAHRCIARRKGIAEDLPRKSSKTKITRTSEHVGIFVRKGWIFLERESGSRRKGLWRLPALSEEEASDWVEVNRFSYAITRFKVDLRVFRVPESAVSSMVKSEQGDWHSLGKDLSLLPPLGAPYRKAIEQFHVNLAEDLEFF